MINSKSERSNTGYKGIYWNKERGKFESYLSIKTRTLNMNLGSSESLREAIKLREDFIKSLF